LFGWQEWYLDSADHLPIRGVLGDTPALAPGSAIGCERGLPHHSLVEPFVAGGSAPGKTGADGVGDGAAGGAGDAAQDGSSAPPLQDV
jgi:hypothetical protein